VARGKGFDRKNRSASPAQCHYPGRSALEGYGTNGVLSVQRRLGAVPFEAVLESVFEPSQVQYAHLRNTEAGCFIARIDRLETELFRTGSPG
jgi:hypothetical protein